MRAKALLALAEQGGSALAPTLLLRIRIRARLQAVPLLGPPTFRAQRSGRKGAHAPSSDLAKPSSSDTMTAPTGRTCRSSRLSATDVLRISSIPLLRQFADAARPFGIATRRARPSQPALGGPEPTTGLIPLGP